MTTFEQLQKENRVLKQRNGKLETQLKGASLNVGKNEHDTEDLQKELKHVKASRTDLENALSNAEGHHARCEEEKQHLEAKLETEKQWHAECQRQKQKQADKTQRAVNEANQLRGDYASLQESYGELDAKYQALVKETAKLHEAQPVTDTESLLRQTVADLTRESRIKNYALEYLMTRYDSECDRTRDLLDIQQELKKALKEAEEELHTVKTLIDEAISTGKTYGLEEHKWPERYQRLKEARDEPT